MTGDIIHKHFRLWRSWITQQIPILKIGGSNPFRRANKTLRTFCAECFVLARRRDEKRNPILRELCEQAKSQENSPVDCFRVERRIPSGDYSDCFRFIFFIISNTLKNCFTANLHSALFVWSVLFLPSEGMRGESLQAFSMIYVPAETGDVSAIYH